MPHQGTSHRPFRLWLLDQARWLLPAVAVVLIGGVGVVLWSSVRRNQQRAELIRERLAVTAKIQSLRIQVQQDLLNEVGGLVSTRSYLVDDVRLQLDEAQNLGGFLDAETRARLNDLSVLLGTSGMVPGSTLLAAVGLLQEIHEAEAAAQQNLLDQIRLDGRREEQAVLGAFGGLLLLALLGAWFARTRVLKPIDELRTLLDRLGQRDFASIEMRGVDPLLEPLFANYNELVTRLAALEEEHHDRARTLEREVYTATRTLLEQHRSLATAERLAAAGVTASAVAHELRNPLAGVLMALENLRRDATDAAVGERITPVIGEVQRVTRLLNQYLADTRHEPEPPVATDLCELVEDLLALLRHQVAEGVELAARIPEDLVCDVPRDRIRQMLLNLILNSIEALGSTPGHVWVRASREEGLTEIVVADDGPGFSEEMLAHGVRPFVTAKPVGTGLGLAMVERTVSDLGGRVSLQNEEAGGAVVRVSFPCRP
jgi:signal transduction histidine kinase